ncbi:MAG: SDR family oxidoreductase [Gammaproteobacteria bacterium]|nr:SDR family oxidoreductase [Gammaproteobacteria bacterium]
MHVVVTGASGFIGNRLCERLFDDGILARPVYRNGAKATPQLSFAVNGIDSNTDWKGAFDGIEAVVHLAARVHIMNDASKDPLAEFREVNSAGTLNLARQAVNAGVKRFIFLSSIKVSGESTTDKSFPNTDLTIPIDPYGISKYEAEQGLLKIAEETGLEVVIIRPPLVYGPGVKANFLSLMRWVYKGVPLPLGAINNKRSFIALDNLVDLIRVCIDHPKAKNQIFLASDDDDLSTTELLLGMAKALGRPSRLIPVPMGLLNMGAKLTGKADIAQRLCGSLQVDISKTKELLNWAPPLSVEQGLQKVADDFLIELG